MLNNKNLDHFLCPRPHLNKNLIKKDLQIRLTTDANSAAKVTRLVEAAQAKMDPKGLTDIFGLLSGLLEGFGPKNSLTNSQVDYDTIVLLSDGVQSSPMMDVKDFRDRIRELNRFARVRIHAIGIGHKALEGDPSWSGLEDGVELLPALAEDSDGRYVKR